jgi:hypothetical protein
MSNGDVGVEGSQVPLAVGHKPAIAINIGCDEDLALLWVLLPDCTNGGLYLLVGIETLTTRRCFAVMSEWISSRLTFHLSV